MADYQANGIIGYCDMIGSAKSGSKKSKCFVSYDFGPKQKPVQITLKKQTPKIASPTKEEIDLAFKNGRTQGFILARKYKTK